MNVTIDKECISLKDYAQQLCKDVNQFQFDKTETRPVPVPQSTTSHVSNPDRPWKVAGGVAIAAGVLTIISSNSLWGYLLGAGGIASWYIGSTKKQSNVKKQPQSQVGSFYLGLDLSERILEFTKEIEGKWNKKVELAKTSVQRVITSSSSDEFLKQSLMGETYYTERINFDVSSFADRLAVVADENLANSIVKEYTVKFIGKIQSVCEAQIRVYNNISKQL